ncbi:SCO family protein [Pseudoalteromonas sp. JBTF-M23]|uniref:SCO family protein n=1 Tax=Pseudoalteromonas caenipelagi TaxID=2726988 RepID=A0A849VGA5_9GAMM|nr:SCO family protein [Pseudoalteromonas caenipelagi]NOU52759.1 SCO family protein [Pseudoalteromonas caenipelagi]
MMRIWWIVALITLASCSKQQELSEHTLHYKAPKQLNNFELYDQKQHVVTNQALLGKWTFVFLGYTSCPDICPMTLAKLSNVYEQLQSDYPVNVWFISVDPNRDNAQKREAYINYFNSQFKGLSNEHTQLFPLVRNMGLIYAINNSDEPEYYVDHSASVALIDPKGNLNAIFKAKFSPSEVPLVDADSIVRDFKIIVSQYAN